MGRLFAIVVLVCWAREKPLLAQLIRFGPIFAGSGGVITAIVETQESGSAPQLRASDFSLVEDGRITAKGASLSDFRQSGKTLSVIFAVDLSGSMRGRPEREAKAALLGIAGRLGPGVQFGLISFGDDARVEFPPGRDALAFRNAVSAMASRGRHTALYDGVTKALDLFPKSLPTSEAQQFERVLVISDGKDEGSRTTVAELVEHSTALHIPVDSVSVDSSADHAFGQVLAAISYGAGGHFYQKSAGELPAVLAQYIDALESTPMVRFERSSVSGSVLTRTAGIQFQPEGRPAQRMELAAFLPAIMMQDPGSRTPQTGNSRLIPLGIAALALAIALLLVMWRRSQKPTADSIGPQAGLSSTPSRPPESDRTHLAAERAARRNRTRVEASEPRFLPPAPNRPSAFLVGMDGPLKDRRYPLQKPRFGIGGDHHNDLFIGDDKNVSPHHAFIFYENGTFSLCDQDSRNGTFVNGHKVAKETWSLKPGDEIRFGASSFRIVEAKENAIAVPR